MNKLFDVIGRNRPLWSVVIQIATALIFGIFITKSSESFTMSNLFQNMLVGFTIGMLVGIYCCYIAKYCYSVMLSILDPIINVLAHTFGPLAIILAIFRSALALLIPFVIMCMLIFAPFEVIPSSIFSVILIIFSFIFLLLNLYLSTVNKIKVAD